MNYFFKHIKIIFVGARGFVLPFTLFICGIMLLISLGISTVLTKQIYFSTIARESQAAYYAADNALACTLSIDETYVDSTAEGIFPSVRGRLPDQLTDMAARLATINSERVLTGYPSLATSLNAIHCGQSVIFDVDSTTSDFKVFETYTHGPEDGVTSTFNMKMAIGASEFRCAKVTVNKTATYKQIIAQGYSRCDRPDGSVERAVVYSTMH